MQQLLSNAPANRWRSLAHAISPRVKARRWRPSPVVTMLALVKAGFVYVFALW